MGTVPLAGTVKPASYISIMASGPNPHENLTLRKRGVLVGVVRRIGI